MNNTQKQKETFIFDNVNDLPLSDRIEMVQIIYMSPYRNKLKEKGNGLQLKLDDLSDGIINKIHTFIIEKMEQYKL
jgi:hypothetical protein